MDDADLLADLRDEDGIIPDYNRAEADRRLGLDMPRRAMEIIRKLAEDSPQACQDSNGHDWCPLCYKDLPWTGSGVSENPSDHDVTCPWRMAKELLAPASEYHHGGFMHKACGEGCPS